VLGQDFGVEVEHVGEAGLVVPGVRARTGGRARVGVVAVAVRMRVRMRVVLTLGVLVVCHAATLKDGLRKWTILLRMAQEDGGLDLLVRQRIRGLRTSLGWSLDDLAARCGLSPSTLSRIETGHRRIGLDQLGVIARALGASIDMMVESVDDGDVVIRPQHNEDRGITTWMLSREPGAHGSTVAKMRFTRPVRRGVDVLRVHPGRDWFTVLSGTLMLLLGERTILVEAGQAAEFSTMVPHAFGAHGGPAEAMGVFDHDGRRSHFRQFG
jgi:transcriptional regulator with XRE-family HTH domain